MTIAPPTAPASAPASGIAQVGDLEIAYETFGSPADPPLLMVMGLGTQMIAWPDDMCAALAGHGRYVIRYDNRDIGMSTHLQHLGVPTLGEVLLRRNPYTVSDMAGDGVGLLDALGLDNVDIVGASMGGFISQTIVIEHPERVRSLTLFMTSTGSVLVGRPKPKMIKLLLRNRVAGSREQAQDEAVSVYRMIGSPGFEFDEQYIRRLAGISYDRARGDGAGGARQLAASIAQPNRTKKLRNIKVPTLVIHGLDDPLVTVSGGLAVARAIPQSRFVGIPGMGHDLPHELIPEFVARIAKNMADAGAA